MCGCELHQSAVGNCTCVCEDHDRYFSHGEVILRKAVRSLNERLYAIETAKPRDEDKARQPDDIAAYAEGRDSDAQALVRMGIDARKWAKEFTRICDGGRVIRGVSPEQDYDKPLDVDESLMTTWFANAIEVGRTAGIGHSLANADRELNRWKDRAIVAERKLRGAKEYFSTVDVTYADEEHA